MGVHYADNPWWLDVLEWGPKSPYAASFDIDWEPCPAIRAAACCCRSSDARTATRSKAGEIELRYDAAEGSFSAWYYEHRLPIDPSRYGEILRKVVTEAGADETPAGRRLLELAARYRGPHNPPRQQAPAFKAELAAHGRRRRGDRSAGSPPIGRSRARPARRSRCIICSSASTIGWRIGGSPAARSTTGVFSTSIRSPGCASRTPTRSRPCTRSSAG